MAVKLMNTYMNDIKRMAGLIDISWEAQNYLPGADPDTGEPNGGVRIYGVIGQEQILPLVKVLKDFGIII